MKKNLLISAVALAVCALASVSCNKEIDNQNTVPSGKPGTVVFKATSAEITPAVKTTISGDGVAWAENDAVSIFWADGNATGYTSAAGKSCEIVAENVADADTYYAFYPQSAGAEFAAGEVTFEVPAVSTGAFADANLSFAVTSAEEKSFEFKNLTGIIHFSVNSADIDKVVFRTTVPVAGTISASFDSDGDPVFGEASETSDTIAVTVGESREAYFSILAGATPESGFTATCYNGTTPVAVVSSANAFTVSRSELWDLGVLDSHVITDYFATPSGAGSKNGKSWDNAFGTAELRELLMSPDDADALAIQALKLDGTTIHMAAGDYVIADSGLGYCKTDFSGYDNTVSVNVLGGYPTGLTGKTTDGRDASANVTAFSGGNQYGILSLGNNTAFSFDGITFKDAHSNNNGFKAFSITATTPDDACAGFTNCAFINNVEANTGPSGMGAVITGATASFENCFFSGNKSRNGSALIMSGGAVVTVSGCEFTGNKSYNTSGAIQNGGATLTVENSSFKSNIAADGYPGNAGYGGAFHTAGTGAVSTLAGCTFESNTGNRGGAISLQAATVTLQDCTFTENKCLAQPADGEENPQNNANGGGAIYLNDANAELTIEGCTFTGNTAEYLNGGAIKVNKSKEVKVLGSTFTGNVAMYFGGAISHHAGKLAIGKNGNDACVFTNNLTTNISSGTSYGGAVYLAGSTTSTMDGAQFTGNTVPREESNGGNGGGVYAAGVTSAAFTNCRFSGNSARNGGGLFLQLSGSSTCTISKCEFNGNRLEGSNTRRGAAVGCAYGSPVFTECEFTNNFANGGSGAFHVNNANSKPKFVKCKFSGNTTNGHGAVANIEAGLLEMENCEFYNNIATSNGGVALLTDGSLTVKNCTFEGNQANNGGCFRVQPKTANKTVVTITGSKFYKSKAGNTGGALALVNDGSAAYTATVSGCEFTENECFYAGAAIHMGNPNYTVTISGCTFSKNYSTKSDGDNFPTTTLENGTAIFDNCVFDSNYGTVDSKAKGIAFWAKNNAIAKFNNCKFLKNYNGNRGLIFLQGNSVVYCNGCLFDGNNVKQAWGNCFHIGGTNAVLMNGCTFYNNPGQYDINGDGYFLIANTTVISQTTNTVFRCGASGKKVYMINNIFSGPSGKTMFALSTALTNGGHNVLSATNGSGYTANATDYIGTVPGASYDSTNGKYLWSGPANISGFTQATASEVKTAIKTDFNVTVNSISNIGNDFATWVESVGGFEADGNLWPGAYQPAE